MAPASQPRRLRDPKIKATAVKDDGARGQPDRRYAEANGCQRLSRASSPCLLRHSPLQSARRRRSFAAPPLAIDRAGINQNLDGAARKPRSRRPPPAAGRVTGSSLGTATADTRARH